MFLKGIDGKVGMCCFIKHNGSIKYEFNAHDKQGQPTLDTTCSDIDGDDILLFFGFFYSLNGWAVGHEAR